jgi:hypothetical protein
MLPKPPEELTRTPLRRLGEGIGKVVYASEHWVVKRERSPSAILSLIVMWKCLRRFEKLLPSAVASRLVTHPSRQIRFLRVLTQGVVAVVPRGVWFMTHIGAVWSMYSWRDVRGESLADTHLTGTALIPRKITFPPTRVKVTGWPGWLNVNEATERVETTLYARIEELARAERFDDVELWLNRLLDVRQVGWKQGVFSCDAHLKNYGVTEDRIVLLDPGGLTNCWNDIDRRLAFEERVDAPHVELGLGRILAPRPDIAARFDARWKATVSRETIRQHWPAA